MKTTVKINQNDFLVETSKYINEETKKTKICLSHTSMVGMNHYSRLSLNDKKNAPHFTIDENGMIYQHFPVECYSEYLENEYFNKNTINIVLVNLGWVTFDNKTNSFKNWYNIIVNDSDVMESTFREYRYWHKYSEHQQHSTLKLCKFLCENYDIEHKCESSVFVIDNIVNKTGVITKSNISMNHVDLSPAFDMRKLSKNIEKIK